MDEADAVRFVVAHLYQRSGRTAMSENELVNAMSLDLKWYPPKDARSLVAALAREGHLRRDDDGDLVPTANVKEVKVPLAFRPPPSLVRGVPEASAAPSATAPAEGGRSSTAPTAPTAPAAPASHEGTPHRAPDPGGHPPVAAADADDQATPDTLLGTILAGLAATTGEETLAWVQRMDVVLQGSGDCLTPEVALIIAAAERGVDVGPWLAGARAALTP